MSDLKNTQEALNKFAKYVIKQSRSNLTRQGKNTTSSLYNSLDTDINVSKNSFSLAFMMDKYGVFQDKGVNPIGKKVHNTEFQFKHFPSLNGKFAQSMAKWAKAKNIRLRDEKGRFKKGNYKTIGYILARSVATGTNKNQGIKPSLFFTKPFNKAFENLPDDLVKAFALDVDNLLDFTTKNILK